VVSLPSAASVPSTGVGRLSLAKTGRPVDVNGDAVVGTGDRIDWQLIVTNTGTVTITSIGVSDRSSGAVTCPAARLSPGASMTCTTPGHTITATDVAIGHVTNVATTSGDGGAVVTAAATATVNLLHELPSTGQSRLSQLLVSGVGLILLGTLMLATTARRRKQRPHTAAHIGIVRMS
jgi:LPXTG-motif cell wall-anchored protein